MEFPAHKMVGVYINARGNFLLGFCLLCRGKYEAETDKSGTTYVICQGCGSFAPPEWVMNQYVIQNLGNYTLNLDRLDVLDHAPREVRPSAWIWVPYELSIEYGHSLLAEFIARARDQAFIEWIEKRFMSQVVGSESRRCTVHYQKHWVNSPPNTYSVQFLIRQMVLLDISDAAHYCASENRALSITEAKFDLALRLAENAKQHEDIVNLDGLTLRTYDQKE